MSRVPISPVVVDNIKGHTVMVIGSIDSTHIRLAAPLQHRKLVRSDWLDVPENEQLTWNKTDGDMILNNQCQGIPLSIQLPSLIDNYMGAYGSLIGHFIIASDLIPIIIGNGPLDTMHTINLHR
jgi:hypothetical protein